MTSINIRGIDVEFPFKPYDVQITYMTKVIEALQTSQNAVLESPTGTGKTLCLLCSVLAWRKAEAVRLADMESHSERLSEGLSAWAEDAVSGGMPNHTLPKIIYASRTHSQLTQVVNELKRTTYGKSAVVSVLGSREQMCIHPEVSKQTSNQTMVHMCRNKVNKHICTFYNNVDDARKNNVFTTEVMDIEDLVTVGKQRNACPYYSAREISKQADCAIIFTPYNYLLDRMSRRSHNLEINGNIIIFDEAHNLEKQCEESASFDVTSLDFAHCIEEVGDLLTAVTKLAETGMIADGHEAGESSALSEFNKEELALMKKLFLALEKSLDEEELPSSTKSRAEPGRFIYDYFSKVNLTFDTCDILLELMEKVFSYLSTLSTSFRTRGAALQRFSEIIKIVFKAAESNSGSSLETGTQTNESKIKEVSKFYRVHICEERPKPKHTDLWKKDKGIKGVATKPIRTLSYWCFSPGYAMKDLLRSGVRNLILTSGTLSPIESFTAELQVDFPITLENDHVIDRHQVFVASLSKGLNGGMLESTYKARSDEEKVLELGRTIVEVLKIAPSGALVFFPSYAAMTHYIELWKEKSNVMEMFELAKPCTVEPKLKSDLRTAIDKYYCDVKSPDGGALFAVCRGKVSEGLDFANDNGRSVIIVGIPFPPWQDPKVKLKMSFLNDLKKSGATNSIQGNEWYRQQACRAVNQAIGRVIRHRYDYGAIVLCDHRYTRKEQTEELPKWIQCHVIDFDDCPRFLRRLKSFFCSIREKERIRLGLNDGKEVASTSRGLPKTIGKTKPTSSGELSFGGVREFIRNLPKASDVDVHISSSGSAWYDKMRQSKAVLPSVSSSECQLYETGKRKRSPEATVTSKRKPGLLDALTESEEIGEAGTDKSSTSLNLGEAEAHRLSTHLLVMDKRMKDERLNKKKKIKLKQPTRSTSASSDLIAPLQPNNASLLDTAIPTEQLLTGPATVFLDTLRRTLSKDSYLKFKETTSCYKRNGDVDAVVTSLRPLLTGNVQGRNLLRSFVRFVCPEHQSRYKELVKDVLSNGNTD